MKKNEIVLTEIINEALTEQGKIPIENIKYEHDLKNDLGIDSLTMVDIVVKIDDEFSIDVFEGHKVRTFGDLVKIIEEIK